jgi:hypothetical protein
LCFTSSRHFPDDFLEKRYSVAARKAQTTPRFRKTNAKEEEDKEAVLCVAFFFFFFSLVALVFFV